MKKAYFQYYETFELVLSKIKSAEEREHMRQTIINYGLYGTQPEDLSDIEEMAWIICKDLIDQQQHRREVNAANRTSKKATATTEPAPAVTQEPQPEDAAERKSQKRKAFVKPTVEEVAKYCKDKGYDVNAQQFVAFYESNGWKVGRNAMKSWQAAVQNWNTRDKVSKKTSGPMWAGNSADSDTHKYEDLF
jgi:hypothetical protein